MSLKLLRCGGRADAEASYKPLQAQSRRYNHRQTPLVPLLQCCSDTYLSSTHREETLEFIITAGDERVGRSNEV